MKYHRDGISLIAAGMIPAAVCVLLLFSGCGGSDSGEGNVPDPGTIKVISVEPVEVEQKNFLNNGSFEEYYAGTSQPSDALSVPAGKDAASSISRAGESSDGRFGVLQKWEGRDWGLPLNQCFTMAADISPQQNILIEADARVLTESEAFIAVYLCDEKNNWVPVDALRFTTSENFETQRAVVKTGEFTRLRLVARGPNLMRDYPCEVIWDNWRISPVSDAPDGIPVWTCTPPEPEAGNLIANGSLEQWVPGEGAPAGFSNGKDGLANSTIFLDHRTSNGKNCMHQYWWKQETDPVSVANLLQTEADGIQPDQEYLFRVQINTLGTAGGSINISGINSDGEPGDILASIQPEKSGDYKEYEVSFKSNGNTRLLIAVVGPENKADYPARALWDDWRLVKK